MTRLVDKFGASVEINRLLRLLTADCSLRAQAGTHPYRDWCKAVFTDLPSSHPPDLPRGLKQLKLLRGGKP